jgi:putative peptidoglycan lipid II flippase
MKLLIVTAVPAALAGGVMQINLLVGQWVASGFDRAVGWLYAADRLYQLPLGVVGIAVGIVLLPDLSRRLKAEDHEGSRNAFSRAGELSLALTIPCAVALVVIPLPLVSVLFERGATVASDSAAIALAVGIYGLGLPAFVLQKVLQPLYFARQDTKTPFRYAVYAMILNAAIATGLTPWFGWYTPAIAATAAGWLMVAQLAFGARKMGDVARFDARFGQRLWRICLASALMGAVIYGLYILMMPVLNLDYWRYPALVCLITLGILSYGLAGQLTGAFSLAELKGVVRRRRN